MTRRRHLGPLLAALLAGAPAVAAAQEAATADRPEAPGAPPQPVRKPRRPRRRAARRPDPAEAARQQTVPDPEPMQTPRLEAAPVPNRDLEAPRAPGTDRARLSPSVIHRPLPNQGMAAEGAQNIQEERLFFPAPGARLNVPFSY